MAIEGIKITTDELFATAGKIRNSNEKLTNKLGEIKAAMNGLESTWQSEGATTIRGKMNGLEKNFQDYKAVIESYAKFLERAAQSYETTEGAIAGNANAFK
jgi:WXG100 family type VII secretion target